MQTTGGRDQPLLPLMDRLARDSAVFGDRRVASEPVLKRQLEIAPFLLSRMLPKGIEEGGIGQLVEGELGPRVDQVPTHGIQLILIEGVLTSLDALLLVAEDIEEAPADLSVGVAHQPAFLHGGRDRLWIIGEDLGKDQTAFLDQVLVVVAGDGHPDPFEHTVD